MICCSDETFKQCPGKKYLVAIFCHFVGGAKLLLSQSNLFFECSLPTMGHTELFRSHVLQCSIHVTVLLVMMSSLTGPEI